MKKKYKILVLSDLKESTSTTLKSTINLATMINGEIDLFYVKKPTEIIENDNQLSAVRSINEKHAHIERTIQDIVEPISKAHDIKVDYSFSFGNVKNEIENYIKASKPDIVVLGKRKSKVFNFAGDSITHFVLNRYNGVVVIASDSMALEVNEGLSLGILNSTGETINVDFAKDLLSHSQEPLKSFRIVKNSTEFSEGETGGNRAMIEYVFEKRNNAVRNLSKYLTKSNINLLCIDRNKSSDSNSNLMQSDIKEVINKLNVSLMFGSEKFSM